jgi:GNAT superfamily N-acetyltransferase
MITVVPPSVAEQSEAEALFRFQTEAPESVRGALGMSAARIGGGVVLSTRAFGTPVEHYAEMGAATATQPEWHPFAAWLGGEIVGTGTLYVRGETAQMFADAVLPHARKRGGQTALLAARARVARELGCRLLIAETGAEAPGTHNSSLHNMLRLGFQVAYERRNWSWQPAPLMSRQEK